jgi:hypothetical protein
MRWGRELACDRVGVDQGASLPFGLFFLPRLDVVADLKVFLVGDVVAV